MYDVEILKPGSVAEAAQILADNPDEAKLIAGGTAIVLMLTQRLIAPRYLVSLGHLPGLRAVTHEPGVGLRLGALVTHAEAEHSPVVQQMAPVLAATFHKVANVRVRHQATVGGVLCEADYASDPPAVLQALRARVRAVSPRGERWLDLTGFFADFYTTALAPDEVLTEVLVPELPAGAGAAYTKFSSRSSEDRPCVGVAVVAERQDGVCAGLRVVVGAVAGTPQEVPEAEALASGRPMTEALARQIGQAYADAINPLSDLRGSEWYRRQVIAALVRRTILEVLPA